MNNEPTVTITAREFVDLITRAALGGDRADVEAPEDGKSLFNMDKNEEHDKEIAKLQDKIAALKAEINNAKETIDLLTDDRDPPPTPTGGDTACNVICPNCLEVLSVSSPGGFSLCNCGVMVERMPRTISESVEIYGANYMCPMCDAHLNFCIGETWECPCGIKHTRFEGYVSLNPSPAPTNTTQCAPAA